MARLNIPSVSESPVASQPLLAAVEKQLGVVPNLMRLVGQSPAALEGYLSLNGALAKGTLDARTRERIALATAQSNGCEYCLSAHTYLAQHAAKLPDAEIAKARRAQAGEPKAQAALEFARRVLESRGQVSDDDLARVKAAGYEEAAIVEIVLNVALNVLTNYVNNVAKTTVDFPVVTVE